MAYSLKREISRWALGALVLNSIVGAGIFGLPSEAARLTGAFSPVMFAICGLLMATVMLSLGQAASYFSDTGGPILYSRTAFGSLVGFETGWVLYMGRATGLAANVNLLTAYTANLWPNADQDRLGTVVTSLARPARRAHPGAGAAPRRTHIVHRLRLSVAA